MGNESSSDIHPNIAQLCQDQKWDKVKENLKDEKYSKELITHHINSDLSEGVISNLT